MKFHIKQDLSIGLNLFFMAITNILILYICYSFFTRHIFHLNPNIFFIVLNVLSFYLAFKLSKYRIFIPIKITFIMIFSFYIAALCSWVLTREYYQYLGAEDLLILIILPFLGFIWMKLYIIIPLIIAIYTFMIFILNRKH